MTNIVKQHAAIALLITILSNFSDCEYCPVSAPTLSVVSKCPTTKTEWDEAASRKKCNLMSSKCGDKTAVYHCLLNQWRNETVEVCASTWYISGFCVIYNTEEMKVIDDFNRDCTNFTEDPCPTRYISTDAYMYQGCYGKRNTSTSLPSTDKQSCVSTAAECTLPAAIIAIIIVLFLLSLSLFVLLVLTCLEKISKSVIVQCIRSCKNTTDEETGNSEKRPKSPHHKREDKDACSTDENMSLLTDQKSASTPTDKSDEENNKMTVPEKIKKFDTHNKLKETDKKEESRKKLKTTSDQKSASTPTDKSDEENNTMTVPEKIKKFDQKSASTPTDKSDEENNTMSVPENIQKIDTYNKLKETDKKEESRKKLRTTSDSSEITTDTSKKDENVHMVNEEEREPISYGRTDSPKDDRKSESNVEDASDTVKDKSTRNEDLNMESVKEKKVIVDGRTDSPNDDRKLECIEKVELEDDQLHENESKEIDKQSGEEERGSENRSESPKDPGIKEKYNAEESLKLITDTESSSASNENENSTEKEDQLHAKETSNLVKRGIKIFDKK